MKFMKQMPYRKRFHKKGFELSANFLVIMILSIAMFGFGIYFVKQIFTKSNEFTLQLDEQTNQRIEELLNDGSRVVIPFQTKTVRVGDLGVYGIGVLNVLGSNYDFKIELLDQGGNAGASHPPLGFKKDGSPMLNTELDSLNLINPDRVAAINNNEGDKFLIGANVNGGAVSGTYVINARVRYNDGAVWNTYGDEIYKLYVVVP